MDLKFILIVLGILGVIAHCLIKAQSLKTDARVANVDFSFMDYLKKDYLGIALSFLAVFVWLLVFEEVAVKYKSLQDFVRVSFFLMGLVGSYLIQTVLSKAKKEIRTRVDHKTDELDKIKQDEIIKD